MQGNLEKIDEEIKSESSKKKKGKKGDNSN